MSDMQIPIYRGEDDLTVTVRVEGQDFTDTVLELEVRAYGRGMPVVLSTEAGGLTLDPPDGIVIHYDAAFIAALPDGKQTTLDLFAKDGTARRKIAAGMITVGKAGQIVDAAMTVVEVPGIRGPKGDRGEKGDKGDTGDRGETGETGAKGDIGETGATGRPGASAQVILVEAVNWPPAADPNPLNLYVKVG